MKRTTVVFETIKITIVGKAERPVRLVPASVAEPSDAPAAESSRLPCPAEDLLPIVFRRVVHQ